ncbi:hypothetical protein [Chitinophaga solisilvae]|uniref:Uncharacterized protein n=1 Tax=Chitinophaga solisilvae TaxID=1233460 RepID=A0A3S1D0D1_9BACT|nr:hypothetical protein [Chitinophaga solisilvae]NSL89592.1 hypothetical protein [Chitinophaga solisilvae]
MSISKHIHALREHLASLGLHPVPEVNNGSQSEVFKVCFLNKYEMKRWKELRQQQGSETNHKIFQRPSQKGR